jgi:hypothetical protein
MSKGDINIGRDSEINSGRLRFKRQQLRQAPAVTGRDPSTTLRYRDQLFMSFPPLPSRILLQENSYRADSRVRI